MAKGLEILILDDDHEAANLLSVLISARLEDAVVRVAYTGEAAVAAGAAQRPDVGVFDLEMDGMDGEAAARTLRKAYPDSRLFLIALSGNVLRLATLRSMGTFDSMLSKPLDVAALLDLIKEQTAALR